MPAEHEHPRLEGEEREAVERELEALSAAVAERLKRAEEGYRQAVDAVAEAEREGLDPMADAAVRAAYLEVQAIQGELEAAAEEARRVAAHLRAQAD